MRQTLEQERARFALDKVGHWRSDKPDDKLAEQSEGYARLVQRLPAMVLTNGLGQTLAFLLADDEGKKKASGHLYDDLAEWLVVKRRIYQGHPDKLIDLVISGDRTTYQQATEETLALSTWLSKFAEAFLK